MEVAITIRTTLEFENIEDINDIQDIVLSEMTAEEILLLANNQGNPINIDVEE